jgi:predicted transcriptional regulator of viral defense system
VLGLWVVLGLDDGQPVASRYRIASAVAGDAYVSHHSAFEYYGVANQVFYEAYVSNPRRFASFDYDGIFYRHVTSRLNDGVITHCDGVRVTDVERTVLDSVNDVDKIAGLEEVASCLSLLPALNPDKLINYLAGYGKQVLYQKTGFLLSLFADQLRLPESFFAQCQSQIGKSVAYLGSGTDHTYNRRWQLVVTQGLEKADGNNARL